MQSAPRKEVQGRWIHSFFGQPINTALVASVRTNFALMRQAEFNRCWPVLFAPGL